MMRPQAVLVDFYGTVVEEDDRVITEIRGEIAAASRTHATAATVGSLWWSTFQRLCTSSYGDTFRLQRDLELISLEAVLAECEAELDAHDLSEHLFAYWSAPQVFPESLNALAACSVPICLVSNIDTIDLQAALTHFGVSFDYVVTSQDVRAYKPRREPFDRALDLLGLQAHQVLHVGDSFGSDIVGAHDLGIPTLWINRKRRRPPIADIADYVAEDLRGLPALLAGDARTT
jgi:2-haloacid dehalogenase/putative hydrolase of the HAD superfamily